MNSPPKVVPLKTAIILAIGLWVTYLTAAFGMGGGKLFRVSIDATALRIAAGVVVGAICGAFAGWLDWRYVPI